MAHNYNPRTNNANQANHRFVQNRPKAGARASKITEPMGNRLHAKGTVPNNKKNSGAGSAAMNRIEGDMAVKKV